MLRAPLANLSDRTSQVRLLDLFTHVSQAAARVADISFCFRGINSYIGASMIYIYMFNYYNRRRGMGHMELF